MAPFSHALQKSRLDTAPYRGFFVCRQRCIQRMRKRLYGPASGQIQAVMEHVPDRSAALAARMGPDSKLILGIFRRKSAARKEARSPRSTGQREAAAFFAVLSAAGQESREEAC